MLSGLAEAGTGQYYAEYAVPMVLDTPQYPRVARKRGNGWYQCLEGARRVVPLS